MLMPALVIALFMSVAPSDSVSGAADVAMLETDSFALGIRSDARVTRMIDKASGAEYGEASQDLPFATVSRNGQALAASTVAFDGSRLTVQFGETDVRAVFVVTPEHRRLVFELVEVFGEGVQEITFAQVPLSLAGDLSEPFGASPLALNTTTNCLQIPGLSSDIHGFTAYARFGLVGARGAIIAAPMEEMREALKDAVSSSADLPHSPLGGPWALEAEINHGSYLIDAAGEITEANVDEWIAAADEVGATQIDFHGGHSFRWGDFQPNPELYPRGSESLKAVIDRIHDAGLAAGLHTYAFFIDKATAWVTPVPDPRLAKAATFTLDADIGASDTTIPVVESTAEVSTVTGFHVRNSVTLQVDDELIVFSDAAREAPYAFTKCERGAYGTRVAAHAKGAEVHQLKECFGLFAPAGESTLFEEIAQSTADAYNECGFDMIYLDALDGSDVPEGWQYAWHYQAKFVFELVKHLRKPAVLEMSTFSHHLWVVRSRMEAWDVPSRGAKRFVDTHALRNRRWQNAFLPTHLGWWGVFDWNAVHPERSFPDDLEYVCAKALATDSSLSYLVGFSPKDLQDHNGRRLASIARKYEELRRTRAVPQSIKTRLAEPESDFILETLPDNGWRFRPAKYELHEVTIGESPVEIVATNPYEAQPLRLRIQVQKSLEPWDSASGEIVAAFAGPGEFGPVQSRDGVAGSLETSPQGGEAVFIAQNDGVDPNRAWVEFRKEFAQPTDLRNRGLGVWVEGDGQGETLNIQLKSPQHLAGGIADHYVHVDFTGRRYFELVEPESYELSDYEWPHTHLWSDVLATKGETARATYPMYHIWVNYENIESLAIGMNNLPKGKSSAVRISPVKSLPLQGRTLRNPSITLGGSMLQFPVELVSGSYLEYVSPTDCKVYDDKGEFVGSVTPGGEPPVLGPGENACALRSDPGPDGSVRTQVTVISVGAPLQP